MTGLYKQESSIILIVEDETDVSEMMCAMVELIFPGVVTHHANNGKQGVELFKIHLPDLVITDINMPEMDGIQMAREIRSICDRANFIVLTGYSDLDSREKFSEIGVIDYIVKPVEFSKLCAAIEKVRI